MLDSRISWVMGKPLIRLGSHGNVLLSLGCIICCGDFANMFYPQAGKIKSSRTRKDKGPAEPSAAALDGVNPLNTTPIGPEIEQNAGETERVQTNLVDTGTRVEDDPLNRNLEQHDEEVVESSNAGRHSAPAGGARDEHAG